MTTPFDSPPFYAGSTLTLRCSVQIDAAIDVPHLVSLVWLKSGATISSDARTTISNVTQLSPSMHDATLVLNPLSRTLDSGTYSCQVSLDPELALPTVQGAIQTDTENVVVQGVWREGGREGGRGGEGRGGEGRGGEGD